jgi:hypothetical protein
VLVGVVACGGVIICHAVVDGVGAICGEKLVFVGARGEEIDTNKDNEDPGKEAYCLHVSENG